MSPTAKNISAAAVGVAYALAYGLWAAIATGGGHVNFIWFWLFIKVELFGLYFPVMAVLAVNLHNRMVRALFATLIGSHVIASVWTIFLWVTETPLDPPSDYSRALRVNGFDGLALCAFLHFFASIVCSGILVAVLLRQTDQSPVAEGDEDNSLG